MTHAFIGQMVLYRLTEEDARKMIGTVEGEIVPMVIAKVSNGTVSGQTFIKLRCLWVTNIAEGDQPGQWEAITDG